MLSNTVYTIFGIGHPRICLVIKIRIPVVRKFLLLLQEKEKHFCRGASDIGGYCIGIICYYPLERSKIRFDFYNFGHVWRSRENANTGSHDIVTCGIGQIKKGNFTWWSMGIPSSILTCNKSNLIISSAVYDCSSALFVVLLLSSSFGHTKQESPLLVWTFTRTNYWDFTEGFWCI